MGRSVEGLRLRRKIVNLRGSGLAARRLQHGLRRDATATFKQAQGIESLETHGFEFLAERGVGGSGEFVGGLFGDSEGVTDFGVALAIADAFGHEAEAVNSPLAESKCRAAWASASWVASSISA